MNNIEIFTELKEDFEALKSFDPKQFNQLIIRLKVCLDRFASGNFVAHLDFGMLDLDSYFETYKNGNLVDVNEARYEVIKLINTVIEDIKVSRMMEDSFSINSESNIIESCSKVFIVHGHDDGAKETVARFVDRLGFKAIILHEQVDSGNTIIEKLEKHTDVGFAIVLYTECDIGGVKSRPEDLKPRARQNVIFEHGLLIGKIGRANVVALVKGDVEIPNDISGVVYKSMDICGSWKYSIAREMKSSGYDVDMNRID